MNDNSTTTLMVQGSTTTVLAPFVAESIGVAIPFFIIAALLILFDLYIGIGAAIVREEKIEVTQAIRRTLSKICEYTCWVMLSATISIAYHSEWLRLAIMAGVLILEFYSIYRNYTTMKRVIIDIPIFKIIGSRIGVDLSDVKIEEYKNEKNNQNE